MIAIPQIRSRRAIWYLAVLGSVCLAHHAFAASDVSTRATNSNRHFSDADLVRGLLLGSGPVAEVVPEVHDYLRPVNFVKDARRLALINNMHDRIMDALTSQQPQFVARFAADVRSGDRVRIEKAYRTAAVTMRETLANLPQVHALRQRLVSEPRYREQLRRELEKPLPADASAAQRSRQAELALSALALRGAASQSDGTCVAAVVAAVVVVAGIATVVVDVNYVVAAQIAALAEVLWSPEAAMGRPGSSSILQDQMVDSVARLLRTA